MVVDCCSCMIDKLLCSFDGLVVMISVSHEMDTEGSRFDPWSKHRERQCGFLPPCLCDGFSGREPGRKKARKELAVRRKGAGGS